MTRQPTGRRRRPWQRCQEKLLPQRQQKLIVDFRRQKREYAPIHINRTAMEKLKSFKFLSVHVTDNLKCTHTDSVVKKAQQRLFNLEAENIQKKYYCTVGARDTSILQMHN
jgi:hypothetical protein